MSIGIQVRSVLCQRVIRAVRQQNFLSRFPKLKEQSIVSMSIHILLRLFYFPSTPGMNRTINRT
jgi:hypothetical protein